MWVELTDGMFVLDPVFVWEHPYSHADGVRQVKCSLYTKDRKLVFSVSYKAEAARAAAKHGVKIGKYLGKILDRHTFEVESAPAKMETSILFGWSQKKLMKKTVIPARELLDFKKKILFMEGNISVYHE